MTANSMTLASDYDVDWLLPVGTGTRAANATEAKILRLFRALTAAQQAIALQRARDLA